MATDRPTLPAAVTPTPPREEALLEIRNFHLRGGGGEDLPADLQPALFFRFQKSQGVRFDYPLFLAPPLPSGRRHDGELEKPQGSLEIGPCAPLREVPRLIFEAISSPAATRRILGDNLLRVERLVRQALPDSAADESSVNGDLVDARELLASVGSELKSELRLSGENAQRLEEDYASFLAAVPSGGRFLRLGPLAPLHLFLIAVRRRSLPLRETFRERISDLARRLSGLVEVDRAREQQVHDPAYVATATGQGEAGLFDPNALDAVVGKRRGTRGLDPRRRQRIEEALATLTAHAARDLDSGLAVLVHDGSLDTRGLHQHPGWRDEAAEDPCHAAMVEFDRESAALADVFRSARLARLELADAYDPARHDPWLEQLDWEGFSREELSLLPTVAAFEGGDRLAGEGMASCTRVLLSGRPIHVLVSLPPARDPDGDDAGALSRFRLELGYLGIGHREAFVQQSSAARPEHLLEGFAASLGSTRASLHVIGAGRATSGRETAGREAAGRETAGGAPGTQLGTWLHAGAALEGRAHPFFRYDPEAGHTWASRMDFSGNPAQDDAWPTHPLECRAEDGSDQTLELPFTFCDFALLEPVYRGHFMVVPEAFIGNADLVSVPEYLALLPDQTGYRIPTVWAADGTGRLRLLAISRALAFACRDRLEFWRTLQELCGIHNAYAEEAAAQARAQAEAEAGVERDALLAAHAEEIERVRAAAATETMQALARTLLELDPAALAASVTGAFAPAPNPQRTSAPPAGAQASGSAAPVAESAPAATEPAPDDSPPAAAAGDEILYDEPFVDTPLCTSCNDCVALNPLTFVYDENKQVVIGDPKASTYAQLVMAAEKCPAKCIHPGRPQNPREPGLEALLERARPFNQ